MAFTASGGIVLVALLAVRPRPVPRAQGQWRVLDHFREGLRYLLARESLWLAVVVMFFISFFPSAVLQLAPAIAKEFDVGQGAYGLIVALFGGGAIVGSVFGAYGMNFEVIPGTKNPYGFWLAMGSMLFVGIAMLAFFKNRRWM